MSVFRIRSVILQSKAYYGNYCIFLALGSFLIPDPQNFENVNFLKFHLMRLAYMLPTSPQWLS